MLFPDCLITEDKRREIRKMYHWFIFMAALIWFLQLLQVNLIIDNLFIVSKKLSAQTGNRLIEA